MRLLVTRPADDAQALAARLILAGHEVITDPMLAIKEVPGPAIPLAGLQAILITSARAVPILAQRITTRDLPVLAVGGRTAAAARAAGFGTVESAGGNADDLVRLAAKRLSPAKGRVLHAAGADRAGDVAGALASLGFEAETIILYEQIPATALARETLAALKAGTLDGALFFSANSARTFRLLAEAADLGPFTDKPVGFCLSAAVAEVLTGFCPSRISPSPDETGMMAILDSR